MISESQQEQATLYALELLDANEADAFERQLGVDVELREFVRDLRETAALLALTGDGSQTAPPPALRERVLAEIAASGKCMPTLANRRTIRGNSEHAAVSPRGTWLPWAIAALLMGCTAGLLWRVQNRQARLAEVERMIEHSKPTFAADPLTQVSFCLLEPTPEFTTAQPRAIALWDAVHHQGKLRINRLAPPAGGKDYQLWTVEAGRKDAVSAGVVHVDANGQADVPFQPVDTDGKRVVAVAISLERAGGSPTNEGPILLLGKF